jgi:hypothetical protein
MTTASLPNAPLLWEKAQPYLLGAAALGGVLGLLGWWLSPEHFFQSYLWAFLIFLNISVGSLTIQLLNNLTGGLWGLAIRRILEAMSKNLLLMAILFIPIAFGMHHIFPWADPAHVAGDELLKKKAPYLNVSFFLIRAAIYFVLWNLIAWHLRTVNSRQERGYDAARERRLRVFSGPALVLHGAALSFAGIDWIMSLEPHWFSSIFPVLVGVSQMLPAMALAIWTLTRQAENPSFGPMISKTLWNDLGNLMLAFVMLWAYMSFSQLLLIWSGNLPEETIYYIRRVEGGWQVLAWVLFLFYFALPFVLLLSRDIKRSPKRIAVVACIILTLHVIHHFWLIQPSFGAHDAHAGPAPAHGNAKGRDEKKPPQTASETLEEPHFPGFRAHWLDAALFLAIGGIWSWSFLRGMQSRRMLIEWDPAWQEYLAHGRDSHGH